MNTYNVTITSLETVTVDGLENVVVIVNWVMSGTDGISTVSYPGTNMVGGPNPNNFIEYPNLTMEEVMSWIPNPLSPAAMANIDQALALESNPPVPTTPPWS